MARSGLVSYAGDSEISDSEDERATSPPTEHSVFTTNNLGIPRSEPRLVSSPPTLPKPIVQAAPTTTLVDYGDEEQNDSKGDNSTMLDDTYFSIEAGGSSSVGGEESATENRDMEASQNSPSSAPLFLNSRDVLLPQEPVTKCSKNLQSKIINLLQRKTESGIDLNSSLQQRKDLRNPSIYEKLVHFCNLDEFGTNYPEHLYDPKTWGEDSFYDNLFKDQKKEYLRKEKAKHDRTTVEFVTGTKKPSTVSKPDPMKKARRSKWDISTNSGAESGGSRGTSPSTGRDRPPLLGSAPIGMQPRVLQTGIVGAQARVQATQLSKELSKAQ
jgi:hypothetical protein